MRAPVRLSGAPWIDGFYEIGAAYRDANDAYIGELAVNRQAELSLVNRASDRVERLIADHFPLLPLSQVEIVPMWFWHGRHKRIRSGAADAEPQPQPDERTRKA